MVPHSITAIFSPAHIFTKATCSLHNFYRNHLPTRLMVTSGTSHLKAALIHKKQTLKGEHQTHHRI